MKPYNLLFVFTCILLILSYPKTTFGFVPPSDTDYYIVSDKKNKLNLIFSENYLKKDESLQDEFHYPQLFNKIHFYNQILKKDFSYRLKDRTFYIFTSPHTQISNALATNLPQVKAKLYSSGTGVFQPMAVSSWLDTILVHEMTHLYQLGLVSQNIRFLKTIFNYPVIIGLFPIIPNPNNTIPLFFTEGHAVLNESLYAAGGRLYSGSVRAHVLFQLKNQFKTTPHFTKHYVLNNTLDTFSGRYKYHHGGYFFSFLKNHFPIKTINRFFIEHSHHFIFPMPFHSLKNSLNKVFHTQLESLISKYRNHYEPLWSEQKTSFVKPLFKSHSCQPFRRQGNKVFFLINNKISTPKLKIYNVKTKKWRTRRKIFSMGKIFKIKRRYYVSTSHYISPKKIVYGLFSEGMLFFKKKYHSQNVQDIKGKNWLSIDTTNNMRGFHLLLNGDFYDTTHSTALFGSKGDIFYFKQQDDNRILFKNKTSLFQFKGFYGKPLYVDSDDKIYFTGPSPYGSTVFSWHEDEGMTRLSSSDTIIEAIPINDQKLLVCELDKHAYSYKIIPIKQIFEYPDYYIYPFKTASSSLSKKTNIQNEKASSHTKQFSDPEVDSSIHADTQNKHLTKNYLADFSIITPPPVSKYNYFKHLSYIGIQLLYLHDTLKGHTGLASINFQDPLEINTLSLGTELSKKNKSFKMSYLNKRYLLNWVLQYEFRQGRENFFGSESDLFIHEISPSLIWEILRKGYWNFGMESSIKGGWVSFLTPKVSGVSIYYILKQSLILNYEQKYDFNFEPHRKFFINISGSFLHPIHSNKTNLEVRTSSLLTLHWGKQFYTKNFIFLRKSNKKKNPFPLKCMTLYPPILI